VYTLWYSILGKPLLIEGCNRHYHWYNSESDRTGCDMVCQDLQNWQYCFIGYVIMCLMPHWSIIFSNMVSGLPRMEYQRVYTSKISNCLLHKYCFISRMKCFIVNKMNKYIFCWNMKGYILLSGKIYQQSEITKVTMQSGHINTISLWVWLLTLWYSSFL
jgi:hypothetical protein